jgi:hypothetical protein
VSMVAVEALSQLSVTALKQRDLLHGCLNLFEPVLSPPIAQGRG